MPLHGKLAHGKQRQPWNDLGRSPAWGAILADVSQRTVHPPMLVNVVEESVEECEVVHTSSKKFV